MTTPVIKAADAATSIVLENWNKANDALGYGGGTNGYGILYDPSSDIGRLLKAKEAIDAAVAAYRSTHWPTDAEYDEAEEVSSQRSKEILEEWS
jgi:hypothetical protein